MLHVCTDTRHLQLFTLFKKALESGGIEVVKRWINSLPQERRKELINKYSTHNGMKALHVACNHNQLEVAKILLESGAGENEQDTIIEMYWSTCDQFSPTCTTYTQQIPIVEIT